MTRQHYAEIIEVLDCEISARPAAGPGIDALLPHLQATRRTVGELTASFAPEALKSLEAFVEAERVCCAGIGWEIVRSPGLQLRISASPAQLDAIQSLWSSKQT